MGIWGSELGGANSSTDLTDTTNIAYLDKANEFTSTGVTSFAGYIGIGTNNPSYAFHIKDGISGATASADADNYVLERDQAGGMSILTPDSSRSRIYFGSPSDNSGAIITWKYDDLSMFIGTAKGGATTIVTSGGSHQTLVMDGNGNTTFQSRIDSTSAFKILDADGGVPIVNVDATNERLSIGSSSSPAKFFIEAGASKGMRVNTDATNNVLEFGTGTGANDYTWSMYKSGNDLIFYDATNTLTPLKLEAGGKIFLNNLGTITGQADVQYNTTTKELGYVSSSIKYKADIVDTDNSNWIYDLRFVNFNRKDTGQNEDGFIAEEVEKITKKNNVSGVVFYKDGKVEGYNKTAIVPYLVNAVQKLKEENNSLKDRLDKIENLLGKNK